MDIAGAMYFPVDCHFTPARVMSVLAREVERAGVRDVVPHRRGRLAAQGKSHRGVAHAQMAWSIEADEFVFCAGFWSQELARELGVKIPMQAGKGYSLTLAKPAIAAAHLLHPERGARCGDADGRRAAIRRHDGARRATTSASMPLAFAAWSIRSPPTIRNFAAELQQASRGTGCARARRTACRLSDASRDIANLSFATGHAMMGMSLGPITGKLDSRNAVGRDTFVRRRIPQPDRYA